MTDDRIILSERINEWLVEYTDLEYNELAEAKEELSNLLKSYIQNNMESAIEDNNKEVAKMSLDLLLAI